MKNKQRQEQEVSLKKRKIQMEEGCDSLVIKDTQIKT